MFPLFMYVMRVNTGTDKTLGLLIFIITDNVKEHAKEHGRMRLRCSIDTYYRMFVLFTHERGVH